MDLMAFGDYLCDVCINIMREMSRMSGITYGSINILLFVILGPLSTIMFMLSALVKFISFKNIKTQNRLSITFFIAGAVCVLLVVLPVLYVFLFGEF